MTTLRKRASSATRASSSSKAGGAAKVIFRQMANSSFFKASANRGIRSIRFTRSILTPATRNGSRPGSAKRPALFPTRTDRVIFASTHDDPNAAKKQKAEQDFRASGKQRRYSWDYDDSFRNLFREPRGQRLEESHPFPRLRRRGCLLAGWETDCFYLSPRRLSD